MSRNSQSIYIKSSTSSMVDNVFESNETDQGRCEAFVGKILQHLFGNDNENKPETPTKDQHTHKEVQPKTKKRK